MTEAMTKKVTGPDGTVVEVRFLEDGSVRVRLPGAWLIEQAFISQSPNKRAILKFIPASG